MELEPWEPGPAVPLRRVAFTAMDYQCLLMNASSPALPSLGVFEGAKEAPICLS